MKTNEIYYSRDNSKWLVPHVGMVQCFFQKTFIANQMRSYVVCAPILGSSKHPPENF